jgi:hypothetical protein
LSCLASHTKVDRIASSIWRALIPQRRIIISIFTIFKNLKAYELKDKSFEKWGKVKYQRIKTNINQPYFYLGSEEKPDVMVLYQDDGCFRFVFADGTEQLDIAYADVESKIASL